MFFFADDHPLFCHQERRVMPPEALNHAFVTLSHLVDYSHCANVKASVQMMEVCRRHVFTPQPAAAAPAAAAAAAPAQLVNLVPTSVGNVAITFNNQLPNQVSDAVWGREGVVDSVTWKCGESVVKQLAVRICTMRHGVILDLSVILDIRLA